MKYLYMNEQERQMQYYQFPKFLLELQLSQNARIIYMLLYDRARISRKNNWTDEDGRVYAIFPIEELSQKTGKCKSSVKDENVEYEKELNAELAKLQKTRQKYMDMYTDDLISREELNEKIGGSRQEMERIENELKMVSYHLTKGEQLENILNNTFKEIEDITDVHQMTNQQLKRLIQKIEVDKEGNVDIYLRLLGDLGLDESVLIEENETVLNCDNQT